MKKILGICLSFLLSLSLIVGCSCKKDEDKDDGKASLQVGDMNAQTYTTLTMSQLNEKINNKDSFVLFGYLEGCYGCQLFKPILENAIKERINSEKKYFGEYAPTSRYNIEQPRVEVEITNYGND